MKLLNFKGDRKISRSQVPTKGLIADYTLSNITHISWGSNARSSEDIRLVQYPPSTISAVYSRAPPSSISAHNKCQPRFGERFSAHWTIKTLTTQRFIGRTRIVLENPLPLKLMWLNRYSSPSRYPFLIMSLDVYWINVDDLFRQNGPGVGFISFLMNLYWLIISDSV